MHGESVLYRIIAIQAVQVKPTAQLYTFPSDFQPFVGFIKIIWFSVIRFISFPETYRTFFSNMQLSVASVTIFHQHINHQTQKPIPIKEQALFIIKEGEYLSKYLRYHFSTLLWDITGHWLSNLRYVICTLWHIKRFDIEFCASFKHFRYTIFNCFV